MKRILLLIIAALALVVVAPIANAADSLPRLRADITVAAEIVTIGDLFDGAGKYAGIPIFRAPDLGHSGTVSAAEIANAVESAGMTDYDRADIVAVTVTRAGREVTANEITELLRTALAGPLAAEPDRIDIVFDLPPAPLVAPQAADLRVARLARSVSGTRFEAIIQAGDGDDAESLRVSGSAIATIDAVTALRPLDRGEIVTADDLTVMRVPARQSLAGAATSLADLVGLEARRSIRAGLPLSGSDFAAPNLVNRGEIITVVYQRGGLLLTTRGKALENGAKDAAIPVMNLSSNRVLTAIVTDRGTVTISAPAATAGKLAMGTAQ
jgi:flagella basal body P-ring formation protein FlgA